METKKALAIIKLKNTTLISEHKLKSLFNEANKLKAIFYSAGKTLKNGSIKSLIFNESTPKRSIWATFPPSTSVGCRREAPFFQNLQPQPNPVKYTSHFTGQEGWGKLSNIYMIEEINYPVIYGGGLTSNQHIRGFNHFLEWALQLNDI